VLGDTDHDSMHMTAEGSEVREHRTARWTPGEIR